MSTVIAESRELRSIPSGSNGNLRLEEDDAETDDFLIDNEVYPNQVVDAWLDKVREKATHILLHTPSQQKSVCGMAKRVLSTVNKRRLPRNRNGDYFRCSVDMLGDMFDLLLDKIEMAMQNTVLNDRLKKQVKRFYLFVLCFHLYLLYIFFCYFILFYFM